MSGLLAPSWWTIVVVITVVGVSQSAAIGLAVSVLAIGLALRRLLTSDVVSGPRVREVVDGPLTGWRSIGDLTCCNEDRISMRDSLTSLRPACCSRQLSRHGISCGTGDAKLCVACLEDAKATEGIVAEAPTTPMTALATRSYREKAALSSMTMGSIECRRWQ